MASNEYLNNKTFEGIIDKFRKFQESNEIGENFEKVKMELSNAFYTLASNIIRAFNFNLVDRDDALQEGVMICFEKLHRFDPKIGRAFNFCTTIILNHYRQLYRSAKNYNELKVRYHNHICEKENSNRVKGARTRNIYRPIAKNADEDQ